MDNGEIKKLLSVVDLRKAIPVAKGCYHKIDIRTHKDRVVLCQDFGQLKYKNFQFLV